MIATLGDFDVGVVARRGQNARREVVIEVRLQRIWRRFVALAEIANDSSPKMIRCDNK